MDAGGQTGTFLIEDDTLTDQAGLIYEQANELTALITGASATRPAWHSELPAATEG